MTKVSTARWRALLLAVVAVEIPLALAAFILPAVWGPEPVDTQALQTLFFGLPIFVVGALVAFRRPEHPIGWGFTAAGLCSATQAAAVAYADAALRTGGPNLPGAGIAGNLTQWIFAPGILFGYTLPFLWFPDGRMLSQRWRIVGWLAVITTVGSTVGNVLAPGPLNNYPHVTNPLGVDNPVIQPLGDFGVLAYIAVMLVAVYGVVLRYRRSTGVQRLQMRWFVVGVALTGLAMVVQVALVFATGDVGWGVILLSGLPICAGIAVLRYRLFDIDRVISRTVTYSVVTALVVTPYVVLSVVASRLASGSGAAVAALTLATLAIARPVHRRVQRGVDRRFNRERYDAGRIVDAFAVRLRDEVDPDIVRADLLGVAATAMQPSSLSLWVPT